MKKFLFLIITALLLISISVYSIVIEKILIKVNDEIITLSDFNTFWNNIKKQKLSKDKILTDKEKKRKLIEYLINEKVYLSLLKEKNIYIRETTIKKAVDQEINTLKERYNLDSDKKLADFLKENYKDVSSLDHLKTLLHKKFKFQLSDNQLIQTFFKEKLIESPTSQEIEKYYNENKEQYMITDLFMFDQLVLKVPKNVEKYSELLKYKKQAKNIIKLARTGKKKFSDLVQKYSAESFKKENIHIKNKWFKKEELKKILPQYIKELEKLKDGEISGIIEVNNDIHIIKRLGYQKGGLRPLVKVKQLISNQLVYKRGVKIKEKLLKEKLGNSKIKFLDKALKEIYK